MIEYDLDTDDLDDAALRQLQVEQNAPTSRRDREQAMPLLVGLLDSATARRSADGTLQLETRGGTDVEALSDAELEELVAKRTAGGGMLDSIANMANSILGAGTIALAVLFVVQHNHYLHICIVGIIGNTQYKQSFSLSSPALLFRIAVCCAASRLPDGDSSSSRVVWSDRLDYPTDSHQCKTERA